MSYTFIPKLGDVYGQWTISSLETKTGSQLRGSSDRSTYWRVRCNCGVESWRGSHGLRTRRTNSCKSCAKTVMHENTFNISYLKRVKGRAIKSNFEFNIDADYIYNIYLKQKGKCALSALPIEFRLNWKKNEQTASLDRIDNTKGYIKGNVQWLHKDINNMKYTFTEEYFINLCKSIAKNN